VEAAVKTVGYALLADIGGSNARFAVLEPDHAYTAPIVLQTADFSGFHTALDTFRQRADVSAPFARAAIGVAGPVTEDGASLTNCGWDLSLAAIRDAIGGGEAVLVNDFTALALSLPALVERDLRRLGGGGRPVPDAARAVLGPGTGLGVSGLVPDGRGGFVPISGEGGHVNLAASNAREMAILARLSERFEHVSAERVLSGPGLRTLYGVLAELAGNPETEIPQPEDIARLAATMTSPIAVEAAALFTRWLGAVAGDLALTLGARGGVYLAGGIVNRWGTLFDAALFRDSFEAKGRFRDYLAPIPTWVITNPFPAFKGLATLV
jgi:glucokinase